MKISINNFGVISKAEINVDGLTVISGVNDTGKSSIGKILFSLVKASSRYKEDLEENQEALIIERTEKIFFLVRKLIDMRDNFDLFDFFHPRRLYNHIRMDFNEAYNTIFSLLNKYQREGVDFQHTLYEPLQETLKEILDILHVDFNEKASIERAVVKVLFSEFKNEMQHGNSSIIIEDGLTRIFDIKLDGKLNNKNSKHIINGEYIGYRDATYVESPTIVQYNELIQMSKFSFDENANFIRKYIPFHLKDLSSKLSDPTLEQHSLFDGLEMFSIKIPDSIAELINGDFYYDKFKKDFILNKNDKFFSSSNIASGIKSLGVLNLLIKNGAVNKNNLLILDEPEVNLHPEWQVFYCQKIVELVDQGVDILVTTHSPYFVDALKHFSNKKKIKNYFYIARNNTNGLSTFDDITDDISIAIDELAAPLISLDDQIDIFDDFDD